MDGQTAEHLQKAICKYSSDEILTVMWVFHKFFIDYHLFSMDTFVFLSFFP
jgi:hypothetical protein